MMEIQAGTMSTLSENLTKQIVFNVQQSTFEALTFLHHKGIAHCDVKPANIFYGYDGTVRLGDFDLCTKIGEQIRGTTRQYWFQEIQFETKVSEKIDFAMLSSTMFSLVGMWPGNFPSKEMMHDKLLKNIQQLDEQSNEKVAEKFFVLFQKF
jgi:serine/threonine protein kinase